MQINLIGNSQLSFILIELPGFYDLLGDWHAIEYVGFGVRCCFDLDRIVISQ